ncbi:hypothetical protein KR009_004019 [Drosophila setifemur]|nr:hypothetical protein KR009_004019 [Drosophila setifemur]
MLRTCRSLAYQFKLHLSRASSRARFSTEKNMKSEDVITELETPANDQDGEIKRPKVSARYLEFRERLRSEAPHADPEVAPNPAHEKEPFEPWPNSTNPHTGEIGGQAGPEPTRYGDWERKGRVSDF